MATETALKPWETLTPMEKREQIALRLGWVMIDRLDDGDAIWQPPTMPVQHVTNTPDWPANDGLAFQELWPKIVAADPSGSIRNRYVVMLGENSGAQWTGKSWAEAICHAAYELLPEVPNG